MRIEWASEQLELLPDRAMYWPRLRTLVIADPHFGKAASFRAFGVPVPGGTTAQQLARLDAVLESTAAAQLLILGDFMHGRIDRESPTLDLMHQWREAHSTLPITLVRGNHDWSAGDPAPPLNIECVDEPYMVHDIAMCHHPEAAPRECAALAGHMHPGIVLRDGCIASTRVPCFHVQQRLALLPAFGVFTGFHIIQPRPDDHVYGIIDGDVVELSVLLRRR